MIFFLVTLMGLLSIPVCMNDLNNQAMEVDRVIANRKRKNMDLESKSTNPKQTS